MTETVRIYSVSHEPDPENPLRKIEVPTTIYEGIGHIVFPGGAVSEISPASQTVAAQTDQVRIPSTATQLVHTDHFAIVTASTVDPSLVGRKWRLTGMPESGQTTAHRFPAEELS
jgi:hypothetical protein